MNRNKLIITAAMLAALSVALELIPPLFKFAGVIDIDIVGVPWIIAVFVLGMRGGLITSFISAIAIGLIAPSGWVGAFMKLAATLPIVLAVGLVTWKFGMGKLHLGIAFVGGALVRVVGMVLLNYYFAMPVFWGIPIEDAIARFPPEIIIIPNFLLAIIDFFGAYLLVTSTRLKERLSR